MSYTGKSSLPPWHFSTPLQLSPMHGWHSNLWAMISQFNRPVRPPLQILGMKLLHKVKMQECRAGLARQGHAVLRLEASCAIMSTVPCCTHLLQLWGGAWYQGMGQLRTGPASPGCLCELKTTQCPINTQCRWAGLAWVHKLCPVFSDLAADGR